MATASESAVLTEALALALTSNATVSTDAVHATDAPRVSIAWAIAITENVVLAAATVLTGASAIVAEAESTAVSDVPQLDAPYNATLAIALTLPASAFTNYSAFLNGSVNPEHNITQWWFDWGTTNAYGSSTPTAVVPATGFPTTVGATIGSLDAPLTTGTTYHYRITAHTDAGTVHGADATFIAQVTPVVVDAGDPLVPYGPAPGIPHFAYPLTITTFGAKTAEQDSLQEVFACVQAIANCPQGACSVLPGFGIPDLAFAQTPLSADALTEAIQAQEPRAEEQVVVAAVGSTGGDWVINADTSTAGAPLT